MDQCRRLMLSNAPPETVRKYAPDRLRQSFFFRLRFLECEGWAPAFSVFLFSFGLMALMCSLTCCSKRARVANSLPHLGHLYPLEECDIKWARNAAAVGAFQPHWQVSETDAVMAPNVELFGGPQHTA